MMLEIAKLLAAFLGDSIAGSLVNEWFRRKRGRVQHVLLIERVNRLVSPELEGFTLARKGGSTSGCESKQFAGISVNYAKRHSHSLENAEVQFEFPADDVSGVASPCYNE